jgi:hypothetical protein
MISFSTELHGVLWTQSFETQSRTGVCVVTSMFLFFSGGYQLCGPGCGRSLCGGQFQRPKGINFGSLVLAWWKSTRMQKGNGSCSRLRYIHLHLALFKHCRASNPKRSLTCFFWHWGLPFELRVGTPFLKQSAAYTPKFASTVCKLHLKYMEPCFFWDGQMCRWGNNSIQLTAFHFDSSPCSVYNGRRHIRDIYAVRCMGNLWKTYARPVGASVLKVSPCELRDAHKQACFK